MFKSLFKRKESTGRTDEEIAEDLYAAALENTRSTIFYTDYGVPDNFDGRFDLLLLHIFLILNRLMGQKNYKNLSQALFDVTFKDMDQTLREMGVGDVGVPKHMKRMMEAFNGRMHAYQMAVAPETLKGHIIDGVIKEESLENVLRRNLYGVQTEVDFTQKDGLKKMCLFVHRNLECKDASEIESLMNGQARFTNDV